MPPIPIIAKVLPVRKSRREMGIFALHHVRSATYMKQRNAAGLLRVGSANSIGHYALVRGRQRVRTHQLAIRPSLPDYPVFSRQPHHWTLRIKPKIRPPWMVDKNNMEG
jgi:hypothetical protein